MEHALTGELLSVELPEGELVCIVHFVPDTVVDGRPVMPPQNPAVNFQVTVSRGKCSEGGFIAFDSAAGDQVHGWMRRDWLRVAEVLVVKGGADGEVEQRAARLVA
jgi:hypothetical protein